MVSLSANVLSGLLSLAPATSRQARLDAYFPVQGFKRSLDPDGGRFSFIFPTRLLADSRRYQQTRRAKGLPIPLTPGLPVVAPGDLPRGYSFGGEENLSLVVAALPTGARALSDWYPDAEAAASWLLKRTVRNHPERVATLIDARDTETPSGSPLYIIEYTVEAPGYGSTHHLCALSVASAESHVTLSYRMPVSQWGASEADARMAVASFDVLPAPQPAGVRPPSNGRRSSPPTMTSSPERTAVSATALLPNTPPKVAYAMMATPANWADLFLFAYTVEATDGADSEVPLRKGTQIRELAGVPPILNELLWVTTRADPKSGVLELASKGSSVLDTIGARDAKLSVSVTSDGDGSRVEVGASFVADGPLAAAVAPALGFELGVSAKLLFPSRLKEHGSSPKAALVWSVLIVMWGSVSYGFFVMV